MNAYEQAYIWSDIENISRDLKFYAITQNPKWFKDNIETLTNKLKELVAKLDIPKNRSTINSWLSKTHTRRMND